MSISRRRQRKPPTTRLHWGTWRPSRRTQNRNSMSRGGAGESEGAFALERLEHETGVGFGPEGATLEGLELDQGNYSGTHQEVPTAVRKVYDSFTVAPQPITLSRTRSEHDAASLQAPMRVVNVNHLSPEPTTLCEERASLEWPNWQRA